MEFALVAAIFKSQSDGAYDVRVSILGHLQQGGSPSPMDRFLGVEIVAECMNRIEEYASSDRTNEFQVVGLQKGIVTFSDASQIHEEMDIQQRRPKHEWWMNSYVLLSKVPF